jgi:hypothetical protein
MASPSWQVLLDEACTEGNLGTPVFQYASDRRGGRTAWSSTVTIRGDLQFQARFWYDGKNLNNAKEDAAEVAYNWIQTNGGSGY